MPAKHKSILMFDLGSRELRWARVERKGGRWQVRSANSAALPFGDGQSEERRQALRATLAKIYWDGGRPAPAAHVALPKGIVILRVFDTPKVGRRELRDILALRAAQEIPHFNSQTVHWDFEIVRGSADETQFRVVLSAVRREALQEFLADFEAVGIQPEVVDVEPLALMRWYLARRRSSDPSDVAVVDLGEAGASISLVTKGRIVQFAQAPISVSEIHEDNGAAADRFVLELQTALQTFGDGQKAPAPQEIIFCGEPQIHEPLAEPIRRQLGAEVRHISQCVDLAEGQPSIPPGPLNGQTHVLEGLLHRIVSKGPALTNLAPRLERVSRWRVWGSRLTGIPALLVLAGVLAVLLVSGGRRINQQRIALLDQAVQGIEPLGPSLDHLEATLNVFRAFEKERFSWMALLAELNRLQPSNITLTTLKMEKAGKMTVSGTVTGQTPIQTVEQFTTALKESPYFDDAQVGAIRPRKEDAVFNLSCTLAGASKGPKGKK